MKIREAAERYLWKKGFSPSIRRLLVILWSTAALSFAAGLAALPWTAVPFWFGISALLSAWNFSGMAFFIQGSFAGAGVPDARKISGLQILFSNLRLFITGIFLYYALVVWRANPVAVAAGLSLAVLCIPAVLLHSSAEKRK